MINQQWFKGVLMITMMTTKDDDKSDEQKAQENQRTSILSETKNIHRKRIKNKSRVQESRRIQDSRRKPTNKNQDSRFKDLKNQDQDPRLKIQE